ncbi:MAG: HAD-IIB family hydrolase [Erysipelotrichaceae bacterium]|nr:HAD-IIB family hydrolase [Erysipelotrichaceae bacterium]
MKLLFVDLDGTLFSGNDVIAPDNTERMAQFRQQGNLIVICTGRNLFETVPAMKQHHIPYDYLILNNGSQVIDGDGQVLYNALIPHDVGMMIVHDIYKDKGQWIFCTDESHCYSFLDGQLYEHGIVDKPIDGDFLEAASTLGDFNILCIAPANQKVEDTVKVKDYLEAHYSESVVCHLNQYYLDIVPPGCSKASAIDLIANQYHDVTTYAIGDSYNDLPMILKCDVGCTFDYASQDIQNQADRVYHYVYELIDEIVAEENQ